jgi:pimeloyl-ACP methyl ester carboxylesterase
VSRPQVPPELCEITLHGQPYSYRTAGPARAPVVVLLHGIAGSSDTWRDILPRLAARPRVIAPDLLGHGRSAKATGDFSLGAHANVIRDLLEAIGAERATIVGHSLGGGVAMQFAYQFPERCERLVLVSSGGLGREVNAVLRAAALPGADVVLPWLCVVGRHSVGKLMHAFGKLGMRASADLEESWRSFVSLEEPEARRAFIRTARSVIDLGGQSVSAMDRLYLAAGLPTLIVWGAKDPLIPVRHAHEAHERLRGSRLEIFEHAGHFPYHDEPERFADLLAEFVKTTAPLAFDPEKLRSRLRSGARPARPAADAPPAAATASPSL